MNAIDTILVMVFVILVVAIIWINNKSVHENYEQKNNTCENKSLYELQKMNPSGSNRGQLDRLHNRYFPLQKDYVCDGVVLGGYRDIILDKVKSMYDERFRGYNYGIIDEYGSPYNTGRISLEKTNTYPVGVNYVF